MVTGKRSGARARKPAVAEPPVVRHGWTLFAHPLFLDQLDILEAGARKERNPAGKATKVLAWLVHAVFDEIPRDPTLTVYRQGGSLGKQARHWFRDKYAGRFRLFFRYDSRAKIIVFAWVNDEDTLRTRGAKNDAYAVFRSMLESGNPPNDWAALLAAASANPAVGRLKALTETSL